MNKAQSGIGHRALAPMAWWVLLVLALFAYRKHQELSARTRIQFSIVVDGQPPKFGISANLDGRPFGSGETVHIGRHDFVVTSPKVQGISTNLFIWYGDHNLGEINLRRGKGTLHIQANPAAPLVTVTGPEFSTTLRDTQDTNLTVPTDQYDVQAEYSHWSQTQRAAVAANLTAPFVFAPKLGALNLTCNRAGATFSLTTEDNQLIDEGDLPKLSVALVAGNYLLTAMHRQHPIRQRITVETGATNDVLVAFPYGAATVNSTPSGANVLDASGNSLGTAILILPEEGCGGGLAEDAWRGV
jgi:hypothetical protein